MPAMTSKSGATVIWNSRRMAVTILSVAALILTVASTPASAATKVGGRCSKAGQTTGIPNGTLTCVKVGKKLVWQNLTSGQVSASARCSKKPATVFRRAPFVASDIALITNGEETNDPRFAYVWLRSPYTPIPVYAPADGTLITIRHLTATKFFPSDDYQLVFEVSAACQNQFGFNHFTAPRADIRAAYQFGDQCSSCFDDSGAPTARYPERETPGTAIRVKAGDLLGYTSGTPFAHNFDYWVRVGGKYVCPMNVLPEPSRTTLMNLLGPAKSGNQGEAPGPVPGYPCTGY